MFPYYNLLYTASLMDDTSFYVVADWDDFREIVFFSDNLYNSVIAYHLCPFINYMLYEFVFLNQSLSAIYVIDPSGNRQCCIASYSDIA